jgi:hypothetical protein
MEIVSISESRDSDTAHLVDAQAYRYDDPKVTALCGAVLNLPTAILPADESLMCETCVSRENSLQDQGVIG